MDPFNPDTVMAESSSMGAAANSGGNIPPQIPDPSPLSAAAAVKTKYVQNEDAQMNRDLKTYEGRYSDPNNPYHEDWRANEVHKRSFGWSDENGREICPITKKAILPDGFCTEHDSRVCISPDGAHPDPNKNTVIPGHTDPVLNKFMYMTKRQRVIEAGIKYDNRYRMCERKRIDLPWDHQAENAMGQKYKTVFNLKGGATMRIKELGLTSNEKQHLRTIVMNDAKATKYEKYVFHQRNIDYMKVRGSAQRQLTSLYTRWLSTKT